MKKLSTPSDFDSPESPVDIPPPIPAFSLKGSLSPLLTVPALIPALTVLLAPPDVLDRASWLRKFTNWMVIHVPHMDAHANSTIFPQMALLADCLVVALVPLLSFVVMWQAHVNYPYLLQRRLAMGKTPVKQHFLVLLGPVVFLGAVAAGVMLPGDPSWSEGATTHRRWFYAVLSFLGPYLAGIVVGSQILNVRLFIDTHLRQGGKK